MNAKLVRIAQGSLCERSAWTRHTTFLRAQLSFCPTARRVGCDDDVTRHRDWLTFEINFPVQSDVTCMDKPSWFPNPKRVRNVSWILNANMTVESFQKYKNFRKHDRRCLNLCAQTVRSDDVMIRCAGHLEHGLLSIIYYTHITYV